MAEGRVPAGLLAVGLLCSGLAACTSQEDSYCGTLKDDRVQLRQLAGRTTKSGSEGTTALRDTVGVLAELRDASPDDIHGDWVRLVDAFGGLVAAIKASGADPGDFRSGTKPDGVTDGQFRAVQQAAAELQATPVQQASKSIEQHAQDVCKVDLGSELGGG